MLKTQPGSREICPVGPNLGANTLRLLLILTAMASSIVAVASVSLPQGTKSEIDKAAGEDSDGMLTDVERDIAANRFQDTESRLSGYLKDHPDSSRAHFDLGYVQFRTHNVRSSLAELSRSLELDSTNAEAHKILGLDCSLIGRYDLAEVELIEAARLKPESAEIHYFLGRTYYTRGVYPLAKDELQTSIRLDPASVKAYRNLGLTMEALGDNAEALENYTKAIEFEEHQEQQSAWPYIYLSAFYNRQKNASEALTFAFKAMDVDRRSEATYFEIAKAYRTQKNLQKSADAARTAIAINPQVSDYYYLLGLVLRELGDKNGSAEALAKYAQLQKSSSDTPREPSAEEPLIAPERH